MAAFAHTIIHFKDGMVEKREKNLSIATAKAPSGETG